MFYVMTMALAVHVDILPTMFSEALEESVENLGFYSFELWLESNRDNLLRATRHLRSSVD